MNTDIAVRDVMATNYVGVSEGDRLVDTVELMLEEDADSAVVLRGQEPVGVLTERGVLALLVEADVEGATVADAMTPRVPSVAPDRAIDDAANVMDAEGVRSLFVTEGDEPLGVVTEHDIFSAATLEAPSEPSVVGGNEAGEAETREVGEFSNQSICEECGALARDLADVGGHLLCPNCRDL